MNGENLPFQDLDVIPFTTITSEWGDGIGDDILALAAGTGFDDNAIPPSALNIPYGRIYYSTTGSSGGQVMPGGTTTTMAFGTLDSDSVDITSPATGQLQVNTPGTYKVTAHARCADAPRGSQRLFISRSTDGGSNWFNVSAMTNNQTTIVGSGPSSTTQIYLETGHRLRADYVNGDASSTRIAAADSNQQKYSASLVAAM